MRGHGDVMTTRKAHLRRHTAEDREERSEGLCGEGGVHKFPVSLMCLACGYTTSV